MLIDDANPDDSWVWSKEDEKVDDKYDDIAWELKRIWKAKTYAITIVIATLGAVTTRHKKYLSGTDVLFETIQRARPLGTARVLRKTLA